MWDVLSIGMGSLNAHLKNTYSGEGFTWIAVAYLGLLLDEKPVRDFDLNELRLY